MQDHIPIIDELSFRGQFSSYEIPEVLQQLKDAILEGKNQGFTRSQKALVSSDLRLKEIAPGITLNQWLDSKEKKASFRDIRSYFYQILGSREFIDNLVVFSELEYLSAGHKSIGLGYAHHNSHPCFALPETVDDKTRCRIVELQKNSLDNDGSIREESVHVGSITHKDGFAELRTAWVEILREATVGSVSGDTILKQAWFCFPCLDFSKDAVDDLLNMRPSFPTWKKVIQHLQFINDSVVDFANKSPDNPDSFLEILISRCGTGNASDENQNTKSDKRARQNHCFFFPSLRESRYCFLHTKYAHPNRIYFEHDVSLHKAHIGKLNTHLIV